MVKEIVRYKSPLHQMTQATPTELWNDSADIEELQYAIDNGAVGATYNPVIAVGILKKEMSLWRPRIQELMRELPSATEDQIGWKLIEEMSVRAAKLLEPVFAAQGGRNGRLSIQTDPRLFRDANAIVEQAVAFNALAPNMIVKIPATRAGIAAIEEATKRGISVNATVSFSLPQCLAVAEAVERGLKHREKQGLDVRSMGPVCTIMVGRLDDWLKVQLERKPITVDPGILEWAGVAIFKKAYAIYRERGYRLRLLSAAFRNHMHWSELIGADAVISPPSAWRKRVGQALAQNPELLTYYQARNEQAMVHTATGFAKMRNRLATLACTTSIGPGATNMITGAAAATVHRLPVLLLPGDVFASRRPDPVLQQLEPPSRGDVSVDDAFVPVSRYFDRIERAEQLIPAALSAMRVLTSPADTGAVTLALPQDVQTEGGVRPRAVGRLLRCAPRGWARPGAQNQLVASRRPCTRQRCGQATPRPLHWARPRDRRVRLQRCRRDRAAGICGSGSLHVPGDISIVGFDDVPMAGLARIALTTVAQPRDRLAMLGIATVSDRIEGRLAGPPKQTVVDVNLVVRESTAPLPET